MREYGHPIIRDESGSRNAWSPEVMKALGLKPGGHLPEEGMSERVIQGVRVYVKPAENRREQGYRKSSRHRVMAICECGVHVSVGRLHQHKCRKEAE